MKILHKLLLTYLLIIVSGIVTVYFFLIESDRLLSKSIPKGLLAITIKSMETIDKNLYNNIEHLQIISNIDSIKKALQKSNIEFSKTKNLQDFIESRDNEWIASSKNTTLPFIKEIMENETSQEIIKNMELFNGIKNHLIFSEVFITNRYGAIVGTSNRTTDYRQDDEPWWIETKNNGVYVSDVVFDESAGIFSIIIGIKIEDDKGNFIGVSKGVLGIHGVFDLIEREEEKLKDILGYETIHLKLLDSHRHIIYETETDLKKNRDIHNGEIFEFADKLSDKNGFFIEKGDEEDDNEIFVYAHSKDIYKNTGSDWTLLTEYSVDEIFIPLKSLRNKFLIGALIFIGLIILIAFYNTLKITNPISRLKKTAEKIGEGDFNAKSEINTQDEVGELSCSINKMAENLQKITVSKKELMAEIEERKKTETSLREQENMLASITEAAQDAIFMIDDNSLTIYTNTSASKMFGYSKEDFIGKDLHDIIVPKKYYTKYEVAFKEFVKTGKGPLIGNVIEVTALKKNGIEFPVSISITSVKLNKVWHAVGVVRDITQRKKAEDDIHQKNEMMIAQSRQAAMGEMISMIAHQWRQPLNTLGLQMQDMPEACAHGEMNIEYFENQVKSMMRTIDYMSSTIDDFRDFFKPQKQKERTQVCDIVDAALKIFGKSLESSNIKIEKDIDCQISLLIFGRELQQVFLNILSNAKDAIVSNNIIDGLIKITIKEENSYIHIMFCDNGGGVDKDFEEKLTEPYFTTKGVSGTGLGLFMSKSIIEKHMSGTITYWNEGDGACFYIKIPVRENEQD